jgi:zinc-ribbon domain
LATKKTAAILAVIGGVFYMIGGALVAALLGSVSSGLGGLGSAGGISFLGPFEVDNSNTSSGLGGLGMGNLSGLTDVILAIGLVSGILIIFGGVLINSESSGRRKAGGIIVIVMALVGGLTTLGGLLVGFVLAGIGAYLGLTYKSRGMVIGLGPVGMLTLGSQGGAEASAPAGTGPLNYCIKCGSQIKAGAVFCGACGARIVV